MLCDDGRGTSHLTVSTLALSIPCFRIVGYGHVAGSVFPLLRPLHGLSGIRFRATEPDFTPQRDDGTATGIRIRGRNGRHRSGCGSNTSKPAVSSPAWPPAVRGPFRLAAQGRINVFTARLPDAIERNSSGNSSSPACPSTKSADRITPDSISSNARRMVLGVWWNDASRVRLE